MIKLPKLPDHLNAQWPYLPRQLRARDIEVARAVLEAAALVCQNERLIFSDEEWRIRCELAEELRALRIEGETP
jgi:hypothetical protein